MWIFAIVSGCGSGIGAQMSPNADIVYRLMLFSARGIKGWPDLQPRAA